VAGAGTGGAETETAAEAAARGVVWMTETGMKWEVVAVVIGSKYLGQVEAETEHEAIEKAEEQFADEMHVSVCWQCSEQVGDVGIDRLEAWKVEG
jgi:hypothetical protein